MVVMITSEEYKELVIKANKYDEMQENKIEIKKVTPEEIGKIIDNFIGSKRRKECD